MLWTFEPRCPCDTGDTGVLVALWLLSLCSCVVPDELPHVLFCVCCFLLWKWIMKRKFVSERGGSELIRGGLSKKGKNGINLTNSVRQMMQLSTYGNLVEQSKHLHSLPGMKYTFDLQWYTMIHRCYLFLSSCKILSHFCREEGDWDVFL